MTGDRLIDREAMGVLKARLRNHPADAETRADIVRVYRSLGHLDQAGRFAIGLDEGARGEELRAYADMVRRLSLLPAEHELPGTVRKAIEAGPPPDDWRPWGVVVVYAWVALVAVGLITTSVVYVCAMVGADDVQSIARSWTLITAYTLMLALALTTLWCATSAKWRPALIWSALTALFGGCVALWTVAAFP